jgi:hypothetical protein
VLFLERMLVIGKGGAQLDSEQFNPADLVRCVPALMQLDTNAGLAFYTECLDVLARPDPVAIITEMDQVPNPPRYCILSNMLLPSFSRYFALHLSYVGRMRALELAIAAERYRLANGDWPAAAADLVPRFIEALPIDPGDGKPIRYARFENGIKTWTLLTVDDRKDDGGDVGRLDPIPSKRRPPDTGWVILNPDQRNRSSTSQPEK